MCCERAGVCCNPLLAAHHGHCDPASPDRHPALCVCLICFPTTAALSHATPCVRCRFTVLAFSQKHGEGRSASTTATIGAQQQFRNGWRCKKMPGCRPGPFSSCAKASNTCSAVRRAGRCPDAWNYDVDYNARILTQWCGDECG